VSVGTASAIPKSMTSTKEERKAAMMRALSYPEHKYGAIPAQLKAYVGTQAQIREAGLELEAEGKVTKIKTGASLVWKLV